MNIEYRSHNGTLNALNVTTIEAVALLNNIASRRNNRIKNAPTHHGVSDHNDDIREEAILDALVVSDPHLSRNNPDFQSLM